MEGGEEYTTPTSTRTSSQLSNPLDLKRVVMMKWSVIIGSVSGHSTRRYFDLQHSLREGSKGARKGQPLKCLVLIDSLKYGHSFMGIEILCVLRVEVVSAGCGLVSMATHGVGGAIELELQKLSK